MKLSDYARLCAKSYDGGPDWTMVNDLEFGVFELNNVLRICFRGSVDLDNWLRNLSMWPVRSSNGYEIHAGFDGAFEKLWPVLAPMLPKGKPVIACGHSLGAAIAIRFAEQVNCEVITFGCPKVYAGWGIGPDLNHTRVICDDDPVPDVPLWPYAHKCTRLVNLPDSDEEFINPDDHGIDVYIKRLLEAEL